MIRARFPSCCAHLTGKLKKWGWRTYQKFGLTLAILLLCFAILFAVFRALTPWAKQYKGEIEQHLSTLLGQPVAISTMETSWYWFWPVIKLSEVKILDGEHQGLTLSQLMVGIDLMNSLWHWHIQPGILYIDDVQVTLRQGEQGWTIDGLRQDKKESLLVTDDYLPILNWLYQQEKIILKHVSVNIYFKNGTMLPIHDLNLVLSHNDTHYWVKGDALLRQTMGTKIKLAGSLFINPNELSLFSGQIYLSMRHFLPQQFLNLWPKMHYGLNAKHGDIQAWLDIKKGQPTGIQTKFQFKSLAISLPGGKVIRWIQSVYAHLAWDLTKDGWILRGDDIKLRSKNFHWPLNAILVQKLQEGYRIYAKALMLEPLMDLGKDWPELLSFLPPISSLEGTLYHTQVLIHHQKLQYFLTRFAGLSFSGLKDYPDVSHLSGVLSWRPESGHLALDSVNSTLAMKGQLPVTFEEVNADILWKDAWVQLNRGIIKHPDLVVDAKGVYDHGNVQFEGKFVANDGTQWLRFLPEHLLKPKLEAWVKQDIKRVQRAVGQISFHGDLKDFPFDKKPGEFYVVSELSGMDLYFHKAWPIMTDVSLLLTMNHRTMELNVEHAKLLDIFAQHAKIIIPDMGLGRETLLLHGQADMPAEHLKNYMMASPLKKKLAKLKNIEIEGPIGLDLNLDIPLYPERDEVFVEGAIALKDNDLLVHHALSQVSVKDVTGTLKFDENGVQPSELAGFLFDEPVTMKIESVQRPEPYLSLQVSGDTSIQKLRELDDLPILSFMSGRLNIQSQMKFHDAPDTLDSIKLTSTLEGVEIHLPSPFGKTEEEKAPMSLTFDFNPDKKARLRIAYDEKLSTDLWFVKPSEHFVLDKGLIKLGAGDARWENQPGLFVVGELQRFDLKPWQTFWSKWPSHTTTSSVLNQIDGVDLKINEVNLYSKSYPKVLLTAQKLDKNLWAFHLEQHDILADLRYQFESRTLSGHLDRLYISKSMVTSSSSFHLKPMDLPNLDISIEALKLTAKEDLDLGSVALKSRSTLHHWYLDEGKMTTPGYQVQLKGDWDDEKNETQMSADIQVTNLAESLKFWHISPVIDSHQGNLQFRGGWKGALVDMSLAKLKGDLYVMFQNGVITHLSQETEEKLGIGKLLSILSLQTIPRRLKLDFSDLSNSGYSFDVLKGNFTLKSGVMTTQDTYIDGPVAYASMKGDLDVVKRLYDVTLHVSPHITASLPIVATIAGGPIAGVATWVASKIINQGMQQVTGYTYRVTGPWLSPNVQQVSIYRK